MRIQDTGHGIRLLPLTDLWWLVTLGLSLGMLALMPTSESIWVDEGYMTQIISPPGFRDMLHALVSQFGSEPQMPLTAIFFWLWAIAFGHSELTLRVANLLPLALGLIALALACRRPRLRWPVLLVAASPMTWFYANEIRPYALQLGSAAALSAVVIVVISEQRLDFKWSVVLGLSGVVICGSSMLGVFCLFGVVILLWWLWIKGRLRVGRSAVAILAVFAIFTAALGIYFAFTLLHGSGSGRDRAVSVASIGFAMSELMGFTGLGPGRLSVRDGASAGIQALISIYKPHAISLAIYALIWAGVVGVALVALIKDASIKASRKYAVVALLVPVGIGSALLLLAAESMGFPLWGRHLIWTIPFFMASLACVLEPANETKRRFHFALVLLLLVGSLDSAVHLRFSSIHRKEDYRSAAGFALAAVANDEKVWWAAASGAGEYYGLDFHSGSVYRHDPHHPERNPLPDVIVVSRPEFTDASSFIKKLIEGKLYHFVKEYQGFRIYKKTRPQQ